jgi:molybdate transport system substrate-binding protein
MAFGYRLSALGMARSLSVLAIFALLAVGRQPVEAQSTPVGALTIAAASDLQTIFPELASRFERGTGTKVNISFGSSGTFFAQIQNGAPFDLFFSADVDYPRQLVKRGHGEATSLYQYATGRIVLWTRKDSGIDVKRGLQILTDPRVRKIAIANPRFAPYGRAAEAALRHEGLYDAVRAKLVQGENISQTAQLVDSGNADVAILSESLALGPALQASGTYFEIPSNTHPPIEQAAIVINTAKNKPLARQFLAYIKGPEIRKVFQRYGFSTP